MSEKITLIIPSYNPGKYLREALESIFVQTIHSWQVFIIDDASTDNSLNSIGDLLKDGRVKVVRNPVNIGQSKCMNIGLQFVDTPFFMQLDSDDWLFPNTLEVLMEEGKKTPQNVALIIGNVLEVTELGPGKSKSRIIRRPEWGKTYGSKYELLLANLFPWQKFYRTQAIKNLGGWPTNDPYGGRHAEDLYIFLRLIESYKFKWIDEVVYNYRLHENNSTKDQKLYQEVVKHAITQALKGWGDHYLPLFKESQDGWIFLKGLIPKRQ